MQTLPIGGWIATVDGLGEVKLRISLRDKVAVEVANIPFGICKYSVIGGVGPDVHHVFELCIIVQFGTDKALRKRIHRIPVDLRSHPLAARLVCDRSMMRAVKAKFFLP